ncbi:YitT family protein [endosymbiont GvMRE of Glomus versiforme]|uniref:YitT family protein n=1 Tax=endosymbiont GvMRE of Glomus versiforme TaxID=2039283 RepID=UPI000EE2FA0B|nr:YitT family protein [endosymbiont GvMRE of Glomus versiforme]RHZ35514.1 hypothetical protein GvMRE_IIg262 [endosymbiont GvMRE of Glomus versiforme]
MNDQLKKKIEKKDSVYNVWKQYRKFISDLYLKDKLVKKLSGKEMTINYLSKLIIVFFAAFFTTTTFYFLIDPNGIYNSGLNGLLQTVSKIIVGTSNKIKWSDYYMIYYGLGILTNLTFISFLRIFFKARLEVVSTSIFYVLSQIVWTKVFNHFRLKDNIFSNFSPSNWQTLTSHSQLSFTLPYYITIAIVAAIIHTYGYSLIFQAQATPGGLEIFTSYLSQKKKVKLPISFLIKIFGLSIVFVTILVNFILVEDNTKIRKSLLSKEIEETDKKKISWYERKKIIDKIKKGEIDCLLKGWKEQMEDLKELRKKNDEKSIKKALKISENNRLITSIVKRKIEGLDPEDYPQELEYYLSDNKNKLIWLENEIKKNNELIKNNSKKNSKKCLQRKFSLTERKYKLEEINSKGKVWNYLNYVSNNERLWATIVYIFFSSFLISQIFPRDQLILLSIHSTTEENCNKGLRLLAKFSPVYYIAHQKREQKEETIYIISCHLSKWNYYLYLPFLKRIGKIYETK